MTARTGKQRFFLTRAFPEMHVTIGFFFLLFLAIIIVTPFVYLIVSSLKDLGQFAQTDMKSQWLPWPLHFENYMKAIQQYDILSYLRNSIVLATIQTVTTVFVSAIVAYGFARFKFPGRDTVLMILLGTMMIPSQIIYIPLYTLYRDFGLTGTFIPLILPGFFGSAWNIFFIRQLMLNIPKEMDEAAWIDGSGTFRTFWSIVLPQAKPAIVVTALFTFLYSWKDFLGPLIFLQDKKLWTMPLGLMFFTSAYSWKDYTVQLAAVVMALVPTIVIYIVGQRYFERGIAVTDLK
jgi:ABC-type glycerol-3-phosphate transport system permease component